MLQAKPSRHLWIWGVSESLTKEKLEAEFRKFGPLEDFKLLRDRNSALAEFKNIQDASAAIKGLNKKSIHGDELRVDFLRSQPVKRVRNLNILCFFNALKQNRTSGLMLKVRL